MVRASRQLRPRARWPHVRRMAGTPAATFTAVAPFTVTSSPGQRPTLPFSLAPLRLPVSAPNLLQQAFLPVDLRVQPAMSHTAPKGSVAESTSIYRGSRWHQWRSL